MALSEAEELELLELEEAEAQAGGQTPPGSNPPAELTPPESKTRRFIRGTANALPIIGGIGGSFVAPVAGTAAGAAAGLGVKEAILSSLGDQKPELDEVVGRVAKGTAIDTALTLTGLKAAKYLGKGAVLAKNLVTKPGAAEVAQAGKEALLKVGERGAEHLASARVAKEAAKKGLIEAEEKAGLHFQSTPGFEELLRDPKKMAEFSQRIGRLAKRTPEELSQSVSSEQLQLFRKIAQEGEKVSNLSDIAKSQLREGKGVFTEALGRSEKGIGEALGKFRDADKVVGEIPGQIKRKLVATKRYGEKELLDAKALDKKRKVVKGLAKAAAVYLGAKTLFK